MARAMEEFNNRSEHGTKDRLEIHFLRGREVESLYLLATLLTPNREIADDACSNSSSSGTSYSNHLLHPMHLI